MKSFSWDRPLVWYGALPVFLTAFLFPPRLHGPLNPMDEGVWLAAVQLLLEGKALYRDMPFHYGPVVPWLIALASTLTEPTLSLARAVVWGANAAGLWLVYFCLLRFTAAAPVRAIGALLIFLVPCAAHATTIPFAARYGAGFLPMLFWPRPGQDGGARPALSGLFAGVAVWVSPEIGTAAGAAGLLAHSLPPKKDTTGGFIAGAAAALGVGAVVLLARNSLGAYVDAVVNASALIKAWALPFPRLAPAGWTGAVNAAQNVADALAPWLPFLSYAAVIAWGAVRGRRGMAARRAIPLAAYGLLAAGSAWGRSDRWHIYFALSPALILWASLADQALARSARWGKPAVLFFLATGSLLLLPHYWADSRRQRAVRENTRDVALPRAGHAHLPLAQANGYELLVRRLQTLTKPGEPVVIYPLNGAVYFLADRPSGTRYPLVMEALSPARQKEVAEALGAVRWVVRDREVTRFHGRAVEDLLPVVEDALRRRFVAREEIGPFVFLERREGS